MMAGNPTSQILESEPGNHSSCGTELSLYPIWLSELQAAGASQRVYVCVTRHLTGQAPVDQRGRYQAYIK